MRALLLMLLVLAVAPAQEVYRTFHGYLMVQEKGVAVLRTPQELEAFIHRLPERRLQMKQPAPPNQDPLLQRPTVDFTKRALVAVWSDNVHIRVGVKSVRREGDNLRLDVSYEVPPNYRGYAAPYGYGQYELVEVDLFPGKAIWERSEARPGTQAGARRLASWGGWQPAVGPPIVVVRRDGNK